MTKIDATQSRTSIDWQLVAAVTISTFAWASAWVSIRAAVSSYSPGHLALGRYLVASLVLMPIILARRPAWPPLREWPGIGLMGLLGFTFYNLAINAGEQTVTAGAAAFLSATLPVFSAVGARLFLGEKSARTGWAGLLLSLTGVGVITLGEGGFQISTGALLIVLAALCAAGYGLLQKTYLRRYAALDLTTWAIWMGTLGLLPFLRGLPHAVQEAPLAATLNLVFLGAFPGALGYVLWSYALSKLPVARLMSFLYLVPPISVVLAWLTLGEIPELLSLAGGGLALLGVVLTNATGPRNRATQPVTVPARRCDS